MIDLVRMSLARPDKDVKRALIGIPEYVNLQQIASTIGKHNLRLSKRSISDMIEKLVLDFLLTKYNDSATPSSSRGYDLVLNRPGGKLYLNVKTEEGTQAYSWLCTSNVLTTVKTSIQNVLYFYKLTYRETGEIIRIESSAVAGPLGLLKRQNRIVTYAKGDSLPKGINPGELPTFYNGTHCFLKASDFRKI